MRSAGGNPWPIPWSLPWYAIAISSAAVLTLNQAGQIADMQIYSRPWPVTALFRGEVYKLLRGTLGGEFWQGQPPLAALGEQ